MSSHQTWSIELIRLETIDGQWMRGNGNGKPPPPRPRPMVRGHWPSPVSLVTLDYGPLPSWRSDVPSTTCNNRIPVICENMLALSICWLGNRANVGQGDETSGRTGGH